MTSTHHMADTDIENATPQQISQIGVNTIAINNNATSIATANTNIATNATNITAANSAIVSNDSDITTINDNLATITTSINNNTTTIVANGSAITTLNTTTASNTTNITANSATNTTQTSNIATNATGIATNLATNNTQTTNIATNATGIATNLATNNTQTSNIASNASGIATNLATNNTQQTAINANTTARTTNATNIATNVVNIATNSTELGNIIIGASQLIYKKWRIGEVGTQAYLQHVDLNSGTLASEFCSMRVMDDGDMRLNAPSSKDIQFRINDDAQMRLTAGELRLDNDSDIRMEITAPNANTATLFVGGNDSQGTSRVNWGQAHTNGIPLYGGGIIYNGDDSPNIAAPQDYTMMVNYSAGTESNVLGYYFNDDHLRHYRSLYNENYKEQFYGTFAEPKLIGMTAISSAALSSHRFCYNGASATDNTWYMPDANFKCVCRTPPSVTKAEYVISFTTDGYFSTRQVYVCLSTSSSASDIIPSTITFIHSRNSEWTSRIHRVSVFDTTLTQNAINVRYIFVKEIQVNSSGSVISSGGAQGFIIYGGRDAHNGTTATQTTHYYDNDLTPTTPSDQAQALLVKCWSLPSDVATSASATAPFQLIGF